MKVSIEVPDSTCANRVFLRDVEEHVLIALLIRRRFEIARATTLDLYATSGLVLDVLDICTSGAHNLRSQVEARQRI